MLLFAHCKYFNSKLLNRKIVFSCTFKYFGLRAVYTTSEKFENTDITGNGRFVFEKNSGSEIS